MKILAIVEKVKKQNLSKLFVMGFNVLRMGTLKLRKGRSVDLSCLQNIAPGTVIVVRNGYLALAHSIFTRKNVTFRAEGGELRIGTCFFNSGCSVTAKKRVVIGDDCLFGPNVVIVDHDHDYRCPNEQRGAEYLLEDVTIGKNVVVGANSVILKGTVIGDNCVIGAGTVVSGTIPAGTVYCNERTHKTRKIQFKS